MSFGKPFGHAIGFGIGGDPGGEPIGPPPFSPAPVWTVEIYLDGEDVSANATGEVEVEIEENTARIATFVLKPASGVIDVTQWLGSIVEIYYVPTPGTAEQLFGGEVTEPIYDPETRLVEFRCSDRLQSYFESKSEAEILAEIPNGKYDDQVFGVRRDGWTQAEDVLSTVTGAGVLNRTGLTWVFTDWGAKAVSDWTFYADSARFIEVELARFREIVNQMVIEAEYRYSREHHREHQFLWQYSGLCDFLENPYELPTRDMIAQAAHGTNWVVKSGSICYQTLPDSGTYCVDKNLAITPEAQNQLATWSTWRGVRRWVQTINERYRLTVQESGSIGQYGIQIAEDGAGRRIDNDDAAWDNSLISDAPDSSTGGNLAPYDVPSCGESQLAPGESWVWTDKGDETRRVSLLDTLIAHAVHEIRQAHRRNFVRWQTWIQPTLDLDATLQLDAGGVRARGKLFHMKHTLDLDRGTALTSLKIACSKAPDGGTDDPIVTPPQPDTESGYVIPPDNTVLGLHLGGRDTVPTYDPEWDGFTGNYEVVIGDPQKDQFYPRRFQVDGEDIEDGARDEIDAETVQTFEINAPNDLLELTI